MHGEEDECSLFFTLSLAQRRREEGKRFIWNLFCLLVLSPRLQLPQFDETRDMRDTFYFPPNLSWGSAMCSGRCLMCRHNNAPQQASAAQRTISFTHMFILYLRAILGEWRLSCFGSRPWKSHRQSSCA